jgi:hypothetical protein
MVKVILILGDSLISINDGGDTFKTNLNDDDVLCLDERSQFDV